MLPTFAWINGAASRVEDTYKRLRDCRITLAVADEELLTARANYEQAKYGLLAAKQLTATNDANRELEARTKLPEQWAALLSAERFQRDARLKVALAEVDREEIRVELRLAELVIGQDRGYSILKDNGATEEEIPG